MMVVFQVRWLVQLVKISKFWLNFHSFPKIEAWNQREHHCYQYKSVTFISNISLFLDQIDKSFLYFQ